MERGLKIDMLVTSSSAQAPKEEELHEEVWIEPADHDFIVL